jgi:hypothetical protein
VTAAIELAEPNDSDCRELLGPGHPYTLVSGKNLVLMREARDSIDAGAVDGRWSEMDIDVLPN